MFKIWNTLARGVLLDKPETKGALLSLRTFLSQAYYCEEVWERRLNSPAFQGLNLDELYYELDQSFQKTKYVSPVRFDLFANKVDDVSYFDELLDISYKLRLTPATGQTLNSTPHAIVRALVKWGKNRDLVSILDDRLNYGLFLDYYSANLLLDKFWKSKEFAYGAHVASLLMLQEELEHPLTCALSLLHCYNYLLKPEGWIEHTPPEEPEEEVKVRVKYLRNPFDDDHFDLKDPYKIVGKTLVEISKGKSDQLHQSFHVLGLALYGKGEKLKVFCEKLDKPLIKEIVDLIPKENEAKAIAESVKTTSENVVQPLEKLVQSAYQATCEQDISKQCKVFDEWEERRLQAIEEENQKIEKQKRLAETKRLQKELKIKEQKLWFFENEEQIDVQIEEKEKHIPKKTEEKMKTKSKSKIDEDYVPPQLFSAQYHHKY